MSFITLDCSVTASWFIPDEFTQISINIKDEVSKKGAIVPTIWSLEVGNTLLINERRKRITKEHRQKALYILSDLPIKTDELTFKNVWFETIELAEKYNLTLGSQPTVNCNNNTYEEFCANPVPYFQSCKFPPYQK